MKVQFRGRYQKVGGIHDHDKGNQDNGKFVHVHQINWMPWDEEKIRWYTRICDLENDAYSFSTTSDARNRISGRFRSLEAYQFYSLRCYRTESNY